MLFYSLYCDPLWTLVSGVAWTVPFAAVTISSRRREIILVRCAVLGGCVVLLILGGALEYVYLLSQYTARVQFPDLLLRPRDAVFASVVSSSKYGIYFYCTCVPGWMLGTWLLRGRPRTLVVSAAVSACVFLAYCIAYLFLDRDWWLPVPIYLEHALLALFWTAAIAGYWGALEAVSERAFRWARDRDHPKWVRFRARVPSFSPRQNAIATAIAAVMVASIVPAVKALRYPKELPASWREGLSDEPELRFFLGKNIGLRGDPRFRGSIFFYTFGYDEFLTMDSLWDDGVPTANEYSQLVSPQAIYLVHELFKRDVSYDLNWLRPWINTGGASFAMLHRAFQALGIRYVGGYEEGAIPGTKDFQFFTFPRRQPKNPPGHWVIYEIPDVNIGDFGPTEVIAAGSATAIVAALGDASFDFTRQMVLSTEISGRLVRARGAQLSIIRGGLHVSAQSDGTSLLLLPQQFSHCLRANDDQVRLVRANLIMTGLIFSGKVDTDISFDYGILSPRCRRADFADLKQLGIKLASP